MVTSRLLKDWKIWCSCPAGNYRCKHQFACLLFIHRYAINNFKQMNKSHFMKFTGIMNLKCCPQLIYVNSGVRWPKYKQRRYTIPYFYLLCVTNVKNIRQPLYRMISAMQSLIFSLQVGKKIYNHNNIS